MSEATLVLGVAVERDGETGSFPWGADFDEWAAAACGLEVLPYPEEETAEELEAWAASVAAAKEYTQQHLQISSMLSGGWSEDCEEIPQIIYSTKFPVVTTEWEPAEVPELFLALAQAHGMLRAEVSAQLREFCQKAGLGDLQPKIYMVPFSDR